MNINDTVLYKCTYPITVIREFKFRAHKDLDIGLEIDGIIADQIQNCLITPDSIDIDEYENLDEIEVDQISDYEKNNPLHATKLILSRINENIDDEDLDNGNNYLFQYIDKFDEKNITK